MVNYLAPLVWIGLVGAIWVIARRRNWPVAASTSIAFGAILVLWGAVDYVQAVSPGPLDPNWQPDGSLAFRKTVATGYIVFGAVLAVLIAPVCWALGRRNGGVTLAINASTALMVAALGVQVTYPFWSWPIWTTIVSVDGAPSCLTLLCNPDRIKKLSGEVLLLAISALLISLLIALVQTLQKRRR